MSLIIFLSMMTVKIQVTSTMQAILLLLFNHFHRTGISNLSIRFLPYLGWQEKKVKSLLTSSPQLFLTSSFNPNDAGLFEGSFFWEGRECQFEVPSYF